MSGHNQDNI